MFNISHLTPEGLAILEQVYTNEIQKQLNKFAWADKLLDSNGHRQYGIYFAPGNKLVLKGEISSTIKIIIYGLSIFSEGVETLLNPSLDTKVIDLLERCSKHIRTSIFDDTRDLYTIGDGKRKKTRSNWEQAEEINAIPAEQAIMMKYEYTSTITVRDTETGDEVVITGKNEADELMMFRARTKLWIMRQYDQEIKDEENNGDTNNNNS